MASVNIALRDICAALARVGHLRAQHAMLAMPAPPMDDDIMARWYAAFESTDSEALFAAGGAFAARRS
jgi:hypothetical protein